ncbi:hypothetical protein PIB30_079230 [Stylosanthes scabra]|uniref:Uncharacterized protein n=1 Tax=Stylosanthes scabra TaxID=79078 RepID=A0ABU6TQP5_9FABA|nr:hypothetical protein [Stylosanthes scabra]
MFSSGLHSSRLLPHHRRFILFSLRGSSPPRARLVPSFSLEVFPAAIVDSSSSVFKARRLLVLASSLRFSWRLGFPSMSLFKARVSARRSLTALQFGAMMENARAQESEFE